MADQALHLLGVVECLQVEQELLLLDQLPHAEEILHGALGLEAALLDELLPGLLMLLHEARSHNNVRKSGVWVFGSGFGPGVTFIHHFIGLPSTSNIAIPVLPPLLPEPFEVLDVALQMEDAAEALQFVAISLAIQISQVLGDVLKTFLQDDCRRHLISILTAISE